MKYICNEEEICSTAGKVLGAEAVVWCVAESRVTLQPPVEKGSYWSWTVEANLPLQALFHFSFSQQPFPLVRRPFRSWENALGCLRVS